MTITDDELTGLLTAEFGKGSLSAGLAQIERRGRQRRLRIRVTAAVAALAGLAAAVAFSLDRHSRAERTAAFDRGCHTIYTDEARKSLRSDRLPTTLDAPALELRRGKARLRLYIGPAGSPLFMAFACSRIADGTISGHLSYGPKENHTLDKPTVAYRNHLPDGTIAIVARLRDPRHQLTVTPVNSEVQTAQRDGTAIIWGPPALLAETRLHAGNATLDLANDTLSASATFQQPEFVAFCERTFNRQPAMKGAAVAATSSDKHSGVTTVYLAPQGIALCNWHITPDDPEGGVTYYGPSLTLSWSDNAAVGTVLASIAVDGTYSWVAGPIPTATERVDITSEDGSMTRAHLGNGAFLALIPGKFKTITIITATGVHTIGDKHPAQEPR